MKSSKSALFAALLLVTACTTVNVDPSTQGSAEKEQPPVQDPAKADVPKPLEANPQTPAESGPADGGGTTGGGTEGGTGVDSGGTTGGGVDSGGGGIDAGGGGADSGGVGGSDGGPVVSNTNNWAGWNSATTCPAWNPTPYSWKGPRTSGVGTTACNAGVITFYDAYLGPSASPAAQATWDASNATCKACVFSNWSDPTWGPVVRTPNGHLILNQAGCYAITDPGRLSCAHSSWNFQQCGEEACDASGSQSAYQSCIVTAGGSLAASCGNASVGKGYADSAIYQSGSPAWNACFATGFADNDKQTAMRVLLAFCY